MPILTKAFLSRGLKREPHLHLKAAPEGHRQLPLQAVAGRCKLEVKLRH